MSPRLRTTSLQMMYETFADKGLIKNRVVKCKRLLQEYAGNKHQTILFF